MVSLALLAALTLPFAPSIGLAAGVPIDVATPEQKKVAQGRYELGTKAFGANKLDVALTEFTASYEAVASPNAHFMMARMISELGDLPRAYNELSIVERESKVADKYAATLEQSVALRAELAKKISIVIVNVKGSAGGKLTAKIGATEVPIGEQIAVAPGQVEVEVLVDGKNLKHASATLAPGEIHPFDLDAGHPLEPMKPVAEQNPASGGGRTGFWVGAGIFGAVGVAGFVMGAVEGASASSQYSDLKNSCTLTGAKYLCPASVNVAKVQDSVGQKQTLANVGFVMGGVGAAGAATMLIIGLTRKPVGHDEKAESREPVSLRVGPASIGIEGSF